MTKEKIELDVKLNPTKKQRERIQEVFTQLDKGRKYLIQMYNNQVVEGKEINIPTVKKLVETDSEFQKIIGGIPTTLFKKLYVLQPALNKKKKKDIISMDEHFVSTDGSDYLTTHLRSGALQEHSLTVEYIGEIPIEEPVPEELVDTQTYNTQLRISLTSEGEYRATSTLHKDKVHRKHQPASTGNSAKKAEEKAFQEAIENNINFLLVNTYRKDVLEAINKKINGNLEMTLDILSRYIDSKLSYLGLSDTRNQFLQWIQESGFVESNNRVFVPAKGMSELMTYKSQGENDVKQTWVTPIGQMFLLKNFEDAVRGRYVG